MGFCFVPDSWCLSVWLRFVNLQLEFSSVSHARVHVPPQIRCTTSNRSANGLFVREAPWFCRTCADVTSRIETRVFTTALRRWHVPSCSSCVVEPFISPDEPVQTVYPDPADQPFLSSENRTPIHRTSCRRAASTRCSTRARRWPTSTSTRSRRLRARPPWTSSETPSGSREGPSFSRRDIDIYRISIDYVVLKFCVLIHPLWWTSEEPLVSRAMIWYTGIAAVFSDGLFIFCDGTEPRVEC